MTEAQRAERIARKAHTGQVDKQGQPYILHVERVASAVSEPAKAVAWLHDVLEDHAEYYTKVYGIVKAKTWPSVRLVTRWKSMQYRKYISRLASSGDEIAIEVKLADLRDNLRDGCTESLRKRYILAIERLTA